MRTGVIEPALLFALLSAAVLVFESLRKRECVYDFLFFFNISFLVYYGLAPLHLLLGGADIAMLPNVYREHMEGADAAWTLIKSALVCSLAYAATVCGYLACEPLRQSRGMRLAAPGIAVTWNLIAFSAIMGLTSLSAYVLQFPSLLDPFVNAALIKMNEASDAGALAFLRNLVPVTAVVAPLALAAFLTKYERLKGSQLAFVVVLALLGALALLTQGSRRALVIYFLEFYLLMANFRGRIFAAWLAPLGIAAIILIVFGDIVSLGFAFGVDYMSSEFVGVITKNFSSLYSTFWRDFVYTYQGMVAVMQEYDGLPRLLVDIPYGLLEMVPERLLPLPLPPSLASESTLLIADIPVPLIAEFPPGYVGFLWYTGYLPAVAIVGFLYGWFGAWLSRFFGAGQDRSAVLLLIYSWAAFCWGYFVREGVPSMIITERFHWFFITFLILIAGRVILAPARVAAPRIMPEQ